MGGRTDFQNATLEDKKVGAKNIADAVKKYKCSPIPVVLHLIMVKILIPAKVLLGMLISIQIDRSSLPFDENVELTREVVKYAHERGVSVKVNSVFWPAWKIMYFQLLLLIPIL